MTGAQSCCVTRSVCASRRRTPLSLQPYAWQRLRLCPFETRASIDTISIMPSGACTRLFG